MTGSRTAVAYALALVALVLAGIWSTSVAGAERADLSHFGRAGSSITRVLGYSVEHRPILAKLMVAGDADPTMLVVGSIAGDEPGGTAITRSLASLPAVRGVRLWLIPDMNPDGAARGTRDNADGVDLNRNFAFRWRPFAALGSRYYPGRRAASEPESRVVEAFIAHVRPGLTVWLHQPYGLIDDSQGPGWAEELLSRATGLPLVRLADYPGSAIGWEDQLVAGSAFDLELPGGQLGRSSARRYAEAIRRLARAYANRQPRR